MSSLQRILQGVFLLCMCRGLVALPTENPVTQRWLIEEDEGLWLEQMKNISADCYRSIIECNARCSVACDQSEDCGGIRGTWYRCASNYWLVIILVVVLILFLIVFLVACQCVDKGQDCANVDLYPRILGNHRRSQRRGINTVQYFTAVRGGHRKMSTISYSGSGSGSSQHRSSISSQTPISPYRFL